MICNNSYLKITPKRRKITFVDAAEKTTITGLGESSNRDSVTGFQQNYHSISCNSVSAENTLNLGFDKSLDF